MSREKPIIHARDHRPGGSDPLVQYPTGDTTDEKILAAAPAGFWKLNEDSGHIAHDSSGNGQDMSTTSPELDPLWGADAGPPGEQAANMDNGTDGIGGTASRVSLTWPVLTGDFTAGIWAMRPDVDLLAQVFGQGDPTRGTGAQGWQIQLNASTGVPAFVPMLAWAAPTGTPLIPALNIPADGDWLFLAAVYDSSAAEFRFYVDGLLEGTGDASGYVPAAGVSPKLWIGHDGGLGTTAIRGCRAVLSYAFLVNRAMSGTELLGIVDAPAVGTTPDSSGLVLGIGDDGSFGWVTPQVGASVNGADPAEPSGTAFVEPPSLDVADPTLQWIHEQPFLYGGPDFEVQPRTWTTIPFDTQSMQRQRNITGTGTAWEELTVGSTEAAGWLDPDLPHSIQIVHDVVFGDGFYPRGIGGACVRLESPKVVPWDTRRGLRLFETTHQKALYSIDQPREICASNGGQTEVSKDGYMVSPWFSEVFCDVDPSNEHHDEHDAHMFCPPNTMWYEDYKLWLPKQASGQHNHYLTAGMRVVAQVWHNHDQPLTFHCAGTTDGFLGPMRPHLVLSLYADRDWGEPWASIPLFEE